MRFGCCAGLWRSRDRGAWRDRASVRRLAPAYARYDRALLAFSQAIQANEQKQTAVVRQKLAESQREVEAAIQLADQAQFATLQGYLLAVQGRGGDARGAWNRAVALFPGYLVLQAGF